jgi:hypothetical protein
MTEKDTYELVNGFSFSLIFFIIKKGSEQMPANSPVILVIKLFKKLLVCFKNKDCIIQVTLLLVCIVLP